MWTLYYDETQVLLSVVSIHAVIKTLELSSHLSVDRYQTYVLKHSKLSFFDFDYAWEITVILHNNILS